MTPAMLVAYGLLYDRRAAWRWYAAPVGIALVWVLLFVILFRRFSGYAPTGFHNTFAPEQWLSHYSVYLLSFANHWVHGPADWIMPPALVSLGGAPFVLGALAGLSGFTLALFARRQRIESIGAPWLKRLAWGIALFFLAATPYVPFADRLFLRYGYFGHIGLALGTMALVQGVVESGVLSWLRRNPVVHWTYTPGYRSKLTSSEQKDSL